MAKSRSKEIRRSVKPVGTRPCIMLGLFKVHKDNIDNCLPFLPNLSAILLSIANLLVPNLKSLASSEYTVKGSFVFAEEIAEKDSEFFMGSLDDDSLFTNTQLEETFDNGTNTLFENTKRVEALSKITFKELLSLATKESYFIFNRKL